MTTLMGQPTPALCFGTYSSHNPGSRIPGGSLKSFALQYSEPNLPQALVMQYWAAMDQHVCGYS